MIDWKQIAVMNISYQFFSLEYFFSSISRIGFQNVDLWTGYPHLLLDESYAAQCAAIRQSADEHGLSIVNLTPKVIGWPLNIADENDRVRENAVAYIKRAADAALLLGARSLQLVPGTGLYDRPKEAAWDRSRASLKQIAQYAQEIGVELALEAIQNVETNLVLNAKDLARMVGEVDHPALGAVVDTTHIEKNAETLCDYFDLLGERIRRVHLNESDQLPWGLGHGDLRGHVLALEKAGYNGPCTVEICSRIHYLEPHAAMEQTYRHMQSVLADQG